MSTGIVLQDFKVGRFTFRHAIDLPLEQRDRVSDHILRTLEKIPSTTKCEGELRDPRCPESGTGDFPNIALAAINEKGVVEGAVHLGSIRRINGGPRLFLIEVHAMPAFPDMTPEEEGDLSVEIALFLLTNMLLTRTGEQVRISNLRYAIEDTKLDNHMGVLHDRFQKQMEKFSLESMDDDVRQQRKLFEIKRPTPRVLNGR